MKLVYIFAAISLLGGCDMTTPANSAPQSSTAGVTASNMQGSQSSDTAPPSGVNATPTANDRCGAGQLQHWVGQPLPDAFPTQGPLRIFATGDPVTMDYNATRVNVEVDRSERRMIMAITCG